MTHIPNTTNFKAIQKAIQIYRISQRDGKVRNESRIVGSNTYEPRVSVRLHTPKGRKKYNIRISKIVGFIKYGVESLRKGVQIRHIDGDVCNNVGSNLSLIRVPIVRGNLLTGQIRRIRNLAEKGKLTLTEIALRTGASRTQVSRIANGVTHKNVR